MKKIEEMVKEVLEMKVSGRDTVCFNVNKEYEILVEVVAHSNDDDLEIAFELRNVISKRALKNKICDYSDNSCIEDCLKDIINNIPLHYYELCFYHDEDDDMATENRCSYCIKTMIPPIIDEEIALQILFGNNPSDEEKILMENLTAIIEISETEAEDFFSVDELKNFVMTEIGSYYKR